MKKLVFLLLFIMCFYVSQASPFTDSLKKALVGHALFFEYGSFTVYDSKIGLMEFNDCYVKKYSTAIVTDVQDSGKWILIIFKTKNGIFGGEKLEKADFDTSSHVIVERIGRSLFTKDPRKLFPKLVAKFKNLSPGKEYVAIGMNRREVAYVFGEPKIIERLDSGERWDFGGGEWYVFNKKGILISMGY